MADNILEASDDLKKSEVSLNFRIVYYPFMGTDVNTENLLLMAKLCYKAIGVDQLYDMVNKPNTDAGGTEKTGKFIRNLISSGHWGALEHWYTSFAVEGYSRISSQQNDRHRLMKMFKDAGMGCYEWVNDADSGSPDTSQLQQSQRYVKEDGFNYIVPQSIKEDPEMLERYRKLQGQIRDFQKDGYERGLPTEDVRFALSNATETRFVITTNARQLRHMFNLRCCERSQWEIRNLFNGLLREYKKIAPNIFWKAGASCAELGYCPEGSRSCGKAPTIETLINSYYGRK